MEPILDLVRIEQFFPDNWFKERIKPLLDIKAERGPQTSVFILDDNSSGCTVTMFDGIGTLAHLWTWPAQQKQGRAQRVVLEVAEYYHHYGPRGKRHIPILARYRKDEYHIHRLFTKMGYEVVHEGHDDYMLVMARQLRGVLNA